jgi:hypothetical protein
MSRTRVFTRKYFPAEGRAEITQGDETFHVEGAKFPQNIAEQAAIRGLVAAIMRGVTSMADVKENIAQLESGVWSNVGKELGPVRKLAMAVHQLGLEHAAAKLAEGKQVKAASISAALAFVKEREKAEPGFAESSMALPKFAEAFTRAANADGEEVDFASL